MEKKVSIILINYKNSTDTTECVRSILRQNYNRVSLIIIDNSEEDTYFKELANELKKFKNVSVFNSFDDRVINLKFKKDVFLLKSPENLGFSGGNNIAIELALKNNSDYIWILNNDTVVTENSLIDMIKTAQNYNAEVITCKIKDYRNRELVQYNGIVAQYQCMEDTEDIIRKPLFLSGANLLIRSEVFKKVGLFDEDFFLYFEDNEFHYRLLKHDIKILYTPLTHIYHKGSSSMGGFLKKPYAVYYFVRNCFLLHKKTGIHRYSDAIENFYDIYKKNIINKKLLKASIIGVYDFVKGKVGRRKDIEEIVKQKNLELPEKEDIDKLLKAAFKNPRKKESVDKFIEEVKNCISHNYAKTL